MAPGSLLRRELASVTANSFLSKGPRAHAEFYLPHQLPPRKPVFAGHRLSLRDTGAVFLSGGHAAQHLAVCVLDPNRFGGVDSPIDGSSGQSPRLRRLASGALQLWISGGHIRDRHERPVAV